MSSDRNSLPRLHMQNLDRLSKGSGDAVGKFGFNTSTCCGYLSMSNEWTDDWVV